MKYDDLSIQLGRSTRDGPHVRVSSPLAGGSISPFALPVEPELLKAAFARAVGQSARGVSPTVTNAAIALTVQEIGALLYENVFRDSALGVLDRSLGSVTGTPGRGLRIVVRADLEDAKQAELHSLPWEVLWRSESASFLALDRKTPVVRYVEAAEGVPPARRRERLRVLVVTASPQGMRPLDVDREAANMKRLERRIEGIEIEILARANLASVRRALSERGRDIVHFIGHGKHDAEAGTSTLYFETSDGSEERVETADLVAPLNHAEGMRLVVLNACETGRFACDHPFSALAPTLLHSGLPAVVAMQRPILDLAAIRFGEAFYRRLTAGDPVATAVTDGRLALARCPETAGSWPIPALFLGSPDGDLFGGGYSPNGRGTTTPAPRPTWYAHLDVGNWEAAQADLQRQLALDPRAPMVSTALAVTLARGAPLRRLRYGTAIQMHRLLGAALDLPDDRGLAARCLIALKREYFRANAVREPGPDFEEVVRVALEGRMTPDADVILKSLHTTDRVREIWARIENRRKEGR